MTTGPHSGFADLLKLNNPDEESQVLSVLPKKVPHAQYRDEWQAFWEQNCSLVQATSFQAPLCIVLFVF